MTYNVFSGTLNPTHFTCGLSVCLARSHNPEPCKNGLTDRDAVWDMDSGVPTEAHIKCGHIGATWRIRLNRSHAAEMRPFVKLL